MAAHISSLSRPFFSTSRRSLICLVRLICRKSLRPAEFSHRILGKGFSPASLFVLTLFRWVLGVSLRICGRLAMGAVAELNIKPMRDMMSLFPTVSDLHDPDDTCPSMRKSRDMVEDALVAWRAKQREIHSRYVDLQQQVALAQGELVKAKMEASCADALESAKEELALVQSREKQMKTDMRDLDDCLEAIEEQMLSIEMQKETLEQPDSDEAFLKNELSLFLNVSSILPDLGDPKFSGTFVDKQKGVKTFKLSSEAMSPFEVCQAAWEMMRFAS